MSKVFTLAEVSEHNSNKDCWLLIGGKQYILCVMMLHFIVMMCILLRSTKRHGLPPLNGENMWPTAEGYPVLPPPAKKMSGRSKKNRKKDPCEVGPKNPGKLRRNGVQMTCSNCNQVGHNRRGCKKEEVIKAPKSKGKPGRPRKAATAQADNEGATTSRVSDATVTPTTMESQPRIITPTTSGVTLMGEAGNVFTTMPTEKRTIFTQGIYLKNDHFHTS